MKKEELNKIINKIFKNTIGANPQLDHQQLKERYAKHVELPIPVRDLISNHTTYTIEKGADKYISQENMQKINAETGWMRKGDISNIGDIILKWREINQAMTERVQESSNVEKSDLIYGCENIYGCTNCRGSKNLIFCNDCGDSNYLLGSKGSGRCNFCINANDSINCSNSYKLDYCNKVSESLFIQNCFNLYECMFCAHIANRSFCIANIQLSQEKYHKLKTMIVSYLQRADQNKNIRP